MTFDFITTQVMRCDSCSACVTIVEMTQIDYPPARGCITLSEIGHCIEPTCL